MNNRFSVRIVLPLLLKEIRILPADHQEMAAQFPVPFFSGKLIKLHEADLDLLVAVKTIPAFRPQFSPDAVCELFGNFDDLPVPCRPVIGDRGLHKMSGAVKLMTFPEASELPVRLLYRKIGAEVSVFFLGIPDQVHNTVRQLFQILIHLFGKRIRGSFQPFIDIAVLEDPSVMVTAVFPCRDPEILQGMAFLIRDVGVVPLALDPDVDLVIQHLPLVGNHLTADKFPVARPESICDFRISFCQLFLPPVCSAFIRAPCSETRYLFSPRHCRSCRPGTHPPRMADTSHTA